MCGLIGKEVWGQAEFSLRSLNSYFHGPLRKKGLEWGHLDVPLYSLAGIILSMLTSAAFLKLLRNTMPKKGR